MNTYRIDPNARPDIILANAIKLNDTGCLTSFFDETFNTTATRAEIDRICGESNWLLIDSMTTNKTPIAGERAHFKIGDMVLFSFRKDAPAWDAQIISERSEHGYYKLEIDNPETGKHYKANGHEGSIHSYGHYGKQELLPGQLATDQLSTVTAQRDRLREALRRVMDDEWRVCATRGSYRDREPILKEANEALAACDMESEARK